MLLYNVQYLKARVIIPVSIYDGDYGKNISSRGLGI